MNNDKIEKLGFKRDDGESYSDWVLRTLSEVIEYEQPTNYIVDTENYNDEYDTPVLTANKGFILGYTSETSGIYKNTPVIIFDDFTTDTKYVDFPFKVKSSAIKILSSKNCNIKFLYESIKLIKLQIGGEHKRHWISEYSKLEIKLPCLEEQERIAEFFSALDEKIALQAEKLEQVKLYKKAMLQKMF